MHPDATIVGVLDRTIGYLATASNGRNRRMTVPWAVGPSLLRTVMVPL